MSVRPSVRKRDILFQTLSTVSHATSPSPQFFSKELAQITLVLLYVHLQHFADLHWHALYVAFLVNIRRGSSRLWGHCTRSPASARPAARQLIERKQTKTQTNKNVNKQTKTQIPLSHVVTTNIVNLVKETWIVRRELPERRTHPHWAAAARWQRIAHPCKQTCAWYATRGEMLDRHTW